MVNLEFSIPYNWSGAVNVSKNGWGFEPNQMDYSTVIADQNEQNYYAFQPLVSGYVREPNGVGVEGVSILTSDSVASDVTDTNGYYSLVVPYGWVGIINAEKEFWFIEPNSLAYDNITQDINEQNITAEDGIGSTTSGPAVEGDVVGQKQLINRLNFINFQNGTVDINFRHPRNKNIIAKPAIPQPCIGNRVVCLWEDPSGIENVIGKLEYENMLVANGQNFLSVTSSPVSITKKGICLNLPETCTEDPASCTIFPRPKSVTFNSPSGVIRMFSGLMSW